MQNEIVNKVASSGIITLNLEDFLPKDLVAFDIKPFLFMEMILKEKDFREALKNLDWQQYEHKNVALFCSVDAIIPHWAFMLATIYLQQAHAQVFCGNETETEKKILRKNIEELDISIFENQRIVIKGCGEKDMGVEAYIEISKKLLPVAKSIMYGEPCSTVPLYKSKLK